MLVTNCIKGIFCKFGKHCSCVQHSKPRNMCPFLKDLFASKVNLPHYLHGQKERPMIRPFAYCGTSILCKGCSLFIFLDQFSLSLWPLLSKPLGMLLHPKFPTQILAFDVRKINMPTTT